MALQVCALLRKGSLAALPCALRGIAASLKLALEGALLRDAFARQHSARKQVASLMLGALLPTTRMRFGAGLTGIGISRLLCSGWLFERAVAPAAAVGLLSLGVGELLERGLFFSASPTLRMPGGAS